MKGLNEIVTVLMLVLMVVMFTSLAWFFLFNTTTDVSGVSENLTKQHQIQVGQKAKIENVFKNEVVIRNIGTSDLVDGDVVFFVENAKIDVLVAPLSLKPDEFGKFILNDSQLSMMPDPATMKVTTLGQGDEKVVDFYKKYYIANWNFDEGSGNKTFDSSMYGNDGTCYGMGVSCNWTNGKYGLGINFDGINDYVDVPYAPILNITQPFTIEAWFKASNINSLDQNIIVTRGGLNETNYRLTLLSGGRLQFRISNGTRQEVGNSFPSLNQWHHVTGTYDGTIMKIYVDGNFNEALQIGQIKNTTTDNLFFGKQIGNFGYFNGTIDEVRILNISRPMG